MYVVLYRQTCTAQWTFMEMATSFVNSICDNKLEEIHTQNEEKKKTHI